MSKKSLLVFFLALIITTSVVFISVKLFIDSNQIPTPTPTPTPIPEPIPIPESNLTRLKRDISRDTTDWNIYFYPDYICVHFARDLDAYLDSKGWNSSEVYILNKDHTPGHAIVGIFYEDGGRTYLYLVEPQTDESCFSRYDGNKDGHITFYWECSGLYIGTDYRSHYSTSINYTYDGQYLIVFGESENDY